jgi:F-type H+-transporting ATPase subunit gamma
LLSGTGRDDVHLIVLATADRGLCGGFNSSLARAARRKINELVAAGKTVKLLCVGRKGRDALRRQYGSLIVDTVVLMGVRQITFAEQAQPIGRTVVDMFQAGEFDVCTIFYNRFQSALVQTVTAQQLVPIPMPEPDAADGAADLAGATYEYEPDEAEILVDLLPRNVAVQIFRALLENAASEQGARMTAMDSATRNAGEMIDKLTLTFNRERQASITKELIEIISGAEAV